jgi:hypothetical protein
LLISTCLTSFSRPHRSMCVTVSPDGGLISVLPSCAALVLSCCRTATQRLNPAPCGFGHIAGFAVRLPPRVTVLSGLLASSARFLARFLARSRHLVRSLVALLVVRLVGCLIHRLAQPRPRLANLKVARHFFFCRFVFPTDP